MKQEPIVPSSSTTQDTQADVFFSSFFADPKKNPDYRNNVQFYPAETVIVKEDMPANTVYLIEHGLVMLVRETPKGNTVIIGLRHRDWLIGAPTVLLDKPYNFTIIAVVPTQLRNIPKKDFLEYIKKDEQFAIHVQRALSQQIFDMMKWVEALKSLSAEDRLVRFLANIVREMEPLGQQKPDGFAMPLSNQELDQILMITPEHLCRVLKKTEKKGLVRHIKGSLFVTDSEVLIQ